MFGYIKPFKAELKVKEWEAYQGIYCGLCKQLAQRYGLFARMTLNYDFVFLAMMDMALREQRIHFCQCNCITHPFKNAGPVANLTKVWSFVVILRCC